MKIIIIFLTMFYFSVGHSQIVMTSSEEYTLEKGLSINTPNSYNGSLNARVFAQENILSYNGYQYCSFYHTLSNNQRVIMVGRRYMCSSYWQFLTIDNYNQTVNNLHNVISMGICKVDGTIHLAFDHHNTTLNYAVSKIGVANNPTDYTWDSSVFYPIRSCLNPSIDVNGHPGNCVASSPPINIVTYPRFVQVPNGNLNLVFRGDASAGRGNSYIAYYNGESREWEDYHLFLQDSPLNYPVPCLSGPVRYTTQRSAYFNDLTYDQAGKLHATWTWREYSDPSDFIFNHDLMYAYSTDHGNTWFNNAGNIVGSNGSLTDPITDAKPGIQVYSIPARMSLINSGGQAIDHLDQPHVVTLQRITPHCPPQIPHPYISTSHVHYWRDVSGVWHKDVIPTNGGRAKLYSDQPGNLYLTYVELAIDHNQLPKPVVKIVTAEEEEDWLVWTPLFQGNRECHNQTPHIDREWLQDEGLVSLTYNFYDGYTNQNPMLDGNFYVRDIYTDHQNNPSHRLFPSEDAYVRSGSDAGTNFGTAPDLYLSKVPGSPLERIFLKYDLAPLLSSVNVVSAKLVLKKKGSSNNAEYRFNLLEDDLWNENTITYNNPPSGNIQFLGAQTYLNNTLEYDVTDQVKDELDLDKIISFQLGRQIMAGSVEEFYSKDADQGGLAPMLVVEVLSRCPSSGSDKNEANLQYTTTESELGPKFPSISPNPIHSGSGELSLPEGFLGQDISLDIFNSSGQMVLKKDIPKVSQSTVHLDLSELRPGMYYIRLNSMDRYWQLRLIVVD